MKPMQVLLEAHNLAEVFGRSSYYLCEEPSQVATADPCTEVLQLMLLVQ